MKREEKAKRIDKALKKADAEDITAKGQVQDKELSKQTKNADSNGDAMQEVLTLLKGLVARVDALESRKKKANSQSGDVTEKTAAEMIQAKSNKATEVNSCDDESQDNDGTKAKQVAADSDDDEANALSEFQSRADSVLRNLGLDLPRKLMGESLNSYRYRVLVGLKRHSADFKAADLGSITDPAMMKAVENRIFADAIAARRARAGGDRAVPAREVVRRDKTGRAISSSMAAACPAPQPSSQA